VRRSKDLLFIVGGWYESSTYLQIVWNVPDIKWLVQLGLLLSSTSATSAWKASFRKSDFRPTEKPVPSARSAESGLKLGTSRGATAKGTRGIDASSATCVISFGFAETWKDICLPSMGSRTVPRIRWGPWHLRWVVVNSRHFCKAARCYICCSLWENYRIILLGKIPELKTYTNLT